MIKNAGKSLSSVVVTRVHALLKDMINNEDDQIRNSAASILGILSQVNSKTLCFIKSLVSIYLNFHLCLVY